jgi:hypothetical protein
MIQLDTIVLPDQFYWITKDSYVPVSSTKRMALDGTLVIWEGSSTNQPIDLILQGQEKAFLSYAQLKALQGLASRVNTTYTLIFNSVTMKVRFRHEEPPVLEFTPLVLNPTPENVDNARYYGIIRLMEV